MKSDKMRFPLLYFLWVYAGVLFLITGYLCVTHSGYEKIIKEVDLIMIIFLIAIKSINQITYYLSRNNFEYASKIKCLMFWCTFSIFLFVLWSYLFGLETSSKVKWSEIVGFAFVFIIFAFYLPFYSLDPTYRFFFLKGEIKGSKQ